MSRRTEAVTLLTKVKAVLETTGGYAVKYPNQPFTPPAAAPYVNVIIAPLESSRESLGSQQFQVRAHGILQFDIYVKTDTGTSAMDTVEDLITDNFTDLHLTTSDNEVIYVKQPRPVMFSPKDGLLRKSLQFAFYRDEHRNSKFS